MKKVFFRVWIVLCCIVILFSGFMIVRYKMEKKKVETLLPDTVSRIEEILPNKSTGFIEERSDSSMAAISLNGSDFVGLLEIGDYNLKLPVFAKWSRSDAQRPAVYLGSPYDGSLIIGANYEQQFYFADTMETGVEICFTDLYGQVFTYQVDFIKHAAHADTSVLKAEKCDLTIFVKVKGEYLILRCNIE